MNQPTTSARPPVPPWDGVRLRDAFAARTDRPWTIGYQSIDAPAVEGRASWEGTFPDELAGTLLRNGPARHERGGQRYAHRWDGDGMVQRFALGPDGVSHTGRFVQTQKLIDEDAAGCMIYSGFGTAVDRSAPTLERIEQSNPANISIVSFNGECLALWEAGQPYRIDPDSLATAGRVSWLDAERPSPFSAHPKTGPDGILWNFGIDPLADRLFVYGIGSDGTPRSLRELRVDQISPIHDFGVTEHYLVFPLPSITCNRERLVAGASFAESCQWSPQIGMRLLLVRKTDGAMRELRLPPGCVFHVANAWEAEGRVHVDYLRSADPSSLLAGWSVMAGEYRHMRGACLTRVVADPKAGTVLQDNLIDHDAEFPSILPGDVGRSYRHVLCLERSESRPRDVPGYDRLALIDATSRERDTFVFGNDWLVEEHLLVPGDATTTRKWCVGTAIDLREKATVVSVFDADDLSGGPIAQARLPYALPLGLHGTFIPRRPQ